MGRKKSEKKKYMSVREMGDLLGIKKSDRYYLVKKNFFNIATIAGKMWVETESFEEWYAGQTRYHKVTGEEPGKNIRAKSFSVKEVAALLKISESSTYELIHRNRIPVTWVSGKMQILRKDFWIWHDSQVRYRVPEEAISEKMDIKYFFSIPAMGDLLGIPTAEAYRIAEDPSYASCFRVDMIKDRMYVSYREFDRFLRGQDKYCYDPRRDPDAARVSGGIYLNSRQACWYAKVSRQTLINWCRQERFPVKRAGKNVRITLEEFDRWLERRKEEGRKWHR